MEEEDDSNSNSIPSINNASTVDHQKGISRERTFSPESDWTQLSIKLEDIARMVAKDMKRIAVLAHTVTVKVKLESFDVLSKSQSLGRGVYIHSPDELVNMTNLLLIQIRAQYNNDNNKNHSVSRFSVRLLGVRCSNLISESTFEYTHQSTMDKFLTSIEPIEKQSCKTGSMKNSCAESICYHRQGLGDKLRTDAKLSPIQPLRNHSMGNANMEKMRRCNVDLVLSTTMGKESTGSAKKTRHEKRHNSATQSSAHVTSLQEQTFDEVECVECPLCHRSFLANDNSGLNRHIDACLNGSVIREAIKEEDSRQHQSGKRKQLTDFWSL
jgi:hypothetical protein